MITNEFATFSPDGRYAVRFFDPTQTNHYQSDRLTFRYKFEIVKEKCLGESGIRFENGYLDYFPEVFEGLDAGPLSAYRAYVMLEKNEWQSSDPADYQGKFFYWSSDSRFFTIFVTSVNLSEPNKIVTFDVKASQYGTMVFKGIPDEKQLHGSGDQLITALRRKDAAISRVMSSLLRGKAPEPKPKSRLVRVDEYDGKKRATGNNPAAAPPAKGDKGQKPKLDYTRAAGSPSKRLKRIFWSIYIPSMVVTFGVVSYLITGANPIDPGLRWCIVGAVTAIGTICAILIRIYHHRKINARLRQYLGIGNVVGKDYSVFERVLGRPSSRIPAHIVDQNNRPGYIAVWAGYSYQISILFYADNNKCVSIKHEVLPEPELYKG